MITEQQRRIYTDYVYNTVNFDDFVKKANEIYFNLEPEAYDDKHPEISEFEIERWNNLARKYFLTNKTLQVLDLGSGSGFVADHVCQNLKKEDTFVFADVSEKMLEYCKKRFKNKFVCKLEFKQINSKLLDFPDGYFDIVTMNSVLHHIPDTENILKEINRVLKINGHLIIAHEVNRDFFKHKILWTNYRIMRILKNKGAFIESLCSHLGLIGFYEHYLRSINVGGGDELLDGVNKELMNQKIIHKPLSPSKLGLVMETYSSIGFDIESLVGGTNLILEKKETYNHLNDNPTNFALKLYDRNL